MNITCPACRSAISTDDVNVSTDIALCRRCDKTFSFAELALASTAPTANLSMPPRGAWFEQYPGGFRVGATTRSWGALFLVPFTCVWAGGSLGGIYGTQFLHHRFNLGTSLFGIPFLLGSCMLITMCLITVAGKIELTLRDDQLSIFTGVGLIGWTRRYLWSDFSLVREQMGGSNFNSNRRGPSLALEGKRKASFGGSWNDERRYFVLNVLRSMLGGTPSLASTFTAPVFR